MRRYPQVGTKVRLKGWGKAMHRVVLVGRLYGSFAVAVRELKGAHKPIRWVFLSSLKENP